MSAAADPPSPLANLGAEEDGDVTRFRSLPAVRESASLFAHLFAGDARWAETNEAVCSRCATSPDPHTGAALDALAELRGVVPWLANDEAHAFAARLSRTCEAAPAGVVKRVHDKAFAIRHAQTADLTPHALNSQIRVFSSEEMTDPEAFASEVERSLRAWSTDNREPASSEFTLKPRFGTSGRGRIDGTIADFDAHRITRAAPRLAAAGGAILEPWLARVSDLSCVLWIPKPVATDTPSVLVIACFEQLVTRSGGWLGHLGEVDRRGRIWSGTRFDDELREAGASCATAARETGYFGPLGVDAFTFSREAADAGDSPGEVLRPVVEVNARFTMGLVAAGLVRRCRPWLIETLDLQPGRRLPFLFALRPPKGSPDWPSALAEYAPTAKYRSMPPCRDGSEAGGPALVFDDDLHAVRRLANALTRTSIKSNA